MNHIIERMLAESGLTKSALAARSGLARSTQYRIRDGLVDPTVGSLRELALAAGFDLDIGLVPLSDPVAAKAARVLLDPRFEIVRTEELDAWIGRLQRWVPDGSPVETVRTAGASSSLLKRGGALYFRGSVNELKLASAGSFSKQAWLLSGAAVIGRMEEGDEGVASGQYVAYSGDKHRFSRLLDHVESVRPEQANVIVADYSDYLVQDSWEDGKIKLVAPIQGLIDAFGLGGSLAARAEEIARSW